MKNLQFLFLITFFLIFCEKTNFSCASKDTFVKEPKWTKLPPQKLGIGSEDYFVTVSISTISLTDAEKKCKEGLSSLIYNLTNEYLTRLNPKINTEFDFLLKDLIIKKIKNIIQKAGEYFEVRDKYINKKEKKYYVLGGIQSEKFLKIVSENLEKVYQEENLFNLIKETENIYRVKISSDYYQDEIKTILADNNFIIDNENYFAEIRDSPSVTVSSKLASLRGPLWTVKVRYFIYLQAKKGKIIKKIFSPSTKGIAHSQEEAIKKALAEISIDFEQLKASLPNLKEGIEKYLEEAIKNNLRKMEAKTKVYYAEALKYFENKEYENCVSLLENIHILNKDFPASLILYLRAKGKLTGEIIE